MGYTIHKLKEGQTLTDVADDYNVDLDDLMHLNNISYDQARKLDVGHPVMIPGTFKEDAPAGNIYTVQEGDNLTKIATKYKGVTWKDIYASNKGVIGDDPDLVYAGQKLTIPAAGSAPAPVTDPDAPKPEPLKLRMPVDYIAISEPFDEDDHTGTDFAYWSDPNMPILSVGQGVITKVTEDRIRGKYVQQRIDDHLNKKSLHIMYEHLSRQDCKVGDPLGMKSKIGLMGSTGDSNGPHLHCRIAITPMGQEYNDTDAERREYCVDPLKWLHVYPGQEIGDVTITKYEFLYA